MVRSGHNIPDSPRKSRIGIFGGTFDPVHFGHLRVALEVMEIFRLDRIVFVPAGLPSHKQRPDMASPTDRLEMAKLAAWSFEGFEVSDVETSRSGISYTVDTLCLFSDLYGKSSELFFIMGFDAFMYFHTWKEPKGILSCASVIVMTRPEKNEISGCTALHEYINASISDCYHYDVQDGVFRHPELKEIYFAEVTGLDISGTMIRNLVSEGRRVTFLVPQGVENYILTNYLYV